MRFPRTDLVPVLAIVAGGVIGASLSFSLLGSRSEDVPPDTQFIFWSSAPTDDLDQSLSGDLINSTTAFQPQLTGPVPDDYVLGPGDQILLTLTGNVELAHPLVVTREGSVDVPNVGRISVANLTMADLRVLLRNRLANLYLGITRGTISVAVSITRLRTIQISVTGEVAQPGAYILASVATVTNALFAAGGPTELGSLREISVLRRIGDGDEVISIDLDRDVSGDFRLEQGDVVFVPLR